MTNYIIYDTVRVSKLNSTLTIEIDYLRMRCQSKADALLTERVEKESETVGTTLADLVKGFRHNVREGNPCELRFDGQAIHLYPLPFEVWDKEAKDKFDKTYVGITHNPSIKE